MIASLLDTDLYKYTMMQAVWSRFPSVAAEYAFKCRSAGVDLAPLAAEIRAELDNLGTLSLHPEELTFLRSIRYLKPEFVDSLAGFTLDLCAIEISTEPTFSLRIRGNWPKPCCPWC